MNPLLHNAVILAETAARLARLGARNGALTVLFNAAVQAGRVPLMQWTPGGAIPLRTREGEG